MKPIYCPKCGAQSEGGRFCRSCGTNLVAVSEALGEPDPTRGTITRGGNTTLGIFHSARLTNADRSLDGQNAASIFGTVTIDLTASELSLGETHIHVYSIFGTIDVAIPDDVGIRITGVTLFSSIKVRGTEIGNGLFSANEYLSPGYAQAAQRLHLDATTIFSTAKIKR